MKRYANLSVLCAALTALSAHADGPTDVRAPADAAKAVTGPYVGAAFGAAFGNREIDDNNSRNDEGLGHAAKVYAGYQFSENFGLQAGFVRLRALNQNTGSGATLVKQTVTGESTYVAGTARWPLGTSFALTGKVGVSFGKVSAASPATAATNLLVGSRTSLLIGTGAEYVLNRQLSFSAELESYGKLSAQVKGNALTLGARYTF
jgi:opacity protein-like surface antigen